MVLHQAGDVVVLTAAGQASSACGPLRWVRVVRVLLAHVDVVGRFVIARGPAQVAHDGAAWCRPRQGW